MARLTLTPREFVLALKRATEHDQRCENCCNQEWLIEHATATAAAIVIDTEFPAGSNFKTTGLLPESLTQTKEGETHG